MPRVTTHGGHFVVELRLYTRKRALTGRLGLGLREPECQAWILGRLLSHISLNINVPQSVPVAGFFVPAFRAPVRGEELWQ